MLRPERDKRNRDWMKPTLEPQGLSADHTDSRGMGPEIFAKHRDKLLAPHQHGPALAVLRKQISFPLGLVHRRKSSDPQSQRSKPTLPLASKESPSLDQLQTRILGHIRQTR